MQVPSGLIFKFDLASCDEQLPEVCDDSPVYDLRTNSSNKPVLGWLTSIFFPSFVAADRLNRLTFSEWSHEAGRDESQNAEQPFQMLKDLIFNPKLWCPRRFRNEQSSRILQTDGEERSCRTSISFHAGDNLEKACVGPLDDDVQHQTYHGHGVSPEKADPSPGRGGGGAAEGHQEGSKGTEVVRQAIGKPLSRSKAQTNSNRGLPKVFACAKESPRPQDPEGDCQPDVQSRYAKSCDRKAKRVTEDFAEIGVPLPALDDDVEEPVMAVCCLNYHKFSFRRHATKLEDPRSSNYACVKQQDIDAVRRLVKAASRSADFKPLSVGEWVFV
eukprot:s2457_g10.t1